MAQSFHVWVSFRTSKDGKPKAFSYRRNETENDLFFSLIGFSLTELVIHPIVMLLADKIDIDAEILSEIPADEIKYYNSPNRVRLETIEVKASRSASLIIHDNLEAEVNGAEKMSRFRTKVSDMIELLERNEDSDLLDQI